MMKSKSISHKLSTLFFTAGFALILCAGGLLLHNLKESNEAAESVQTISMDLRIEAPQDEGIVPDYLIDATRDMPGQEIDGYTYIGKLSIPTLDLDLPVMTDWSYPQLKIAPCRYQGSAYTDDMIVCAHNYQSHFGKLDNLVPGDEIQFTDIDGNHFSYFVIEKEYLEKTGVEELRSGDWDLTLFTCTHGGKTRVTIRCEKTEASDFAE